jgi:hypothetical protein
VALDPAMGGGALLAALREAQPRSLLFGLDCDAAVVRRAATDERWTVGKCDFLSARSQSRSTVIRRARESGLNCILLNPPFSCRGGTRIPVGVPGSADPVPCGLAMAFLLQAVSLLGVGGVVGAVIPTGSLHAWKDEEAWRLLRNVCDLETQRLLHRETFGGYFASTALVRLEVQTRDAWTSARSLARTVPPVADVERVVLRGWVQMHSVASRQGPRVPLVHTTDLRSLTRIGALPTVRSRRSCRGAMVLVPRVGTLSREHIAVVASDEPIALSDCLFAIPCSTAAEAQELGEHLRRRWPDLAALYGGSCARYLRRDRLEGFVRSLVEKEQGSVAAEVAAVG